MYKKWFDKTVKQATPLSELQLYFRVSILGLVLFGMFYAYTSWLKIPGVLNKSVADTSVFLIGWSMLLSALCYFWDFADTKIIYRKHLGLLGFAFGVIHWLLSWGAFQRLFQSATWEGTSYIAPLTGTLALAIFAVMAIISNKYSAMSLGGKTWRAILRTGYIALVLVLIHVFALKSARWLTWYEEGMNTPPSASLLVTIFILIVLLMRVALFFALKMRSSKK